MSLLRVAASACSWRWVLLLVLLLCGPSTANARTQASSNRIVELSDATLDASLSDDKPWLLVLFMPQYASVAFDCRITQHNLWALRAPA